jgi:hypothetical protein
MCHFISRIYLYNFTRQIRFELYNFRDSLYFDGKLINECLLIWFQEILDAI